MEGGVEGWGGNPLNHMKNSLQAGKSEFNRFGGRRLFNLSHDLGALFDSAGKLAC